MRILWFVERRREKKTNKTKKKLKSDPEALYSAVLVVTSLTVVSRIVKLNVPGPLFLSLFNHEELFFSRSLKTVVFTKNITQQFHTIQLLKCKKKKMTGCYLISAIFYHSQDHCSTVQDMSLEPLQQLATVM